MVYYKLQQIPLKCSTLEKQTDERTTKHLYKKRKYQNNYISKISGSLFQKNSKHQLNVIFRNITMALLSLACHDT